MGHKDELLREDNEALHCSDWMGHEDEGVHCSDWMRKESEAVLTGWDTRLKASVF